MGDVEPDAALGSAPALGDLGVVGQRHPVTGGQLHPLGVVALHETLTGGVAEDPAFTAGGLRHQSARGVLRFDDARRVELDELSVADSPARQRCQPEGIAGVLVAARRGVPPDPGVPAGGEHDGVGVDDHSCAVDDVEPVGTEDLVVRHQQP